MDGVEVIRRQPFGDNPDVGERGASTQRSILDAALSVFADHGFHETRVELITEAAGCSRPAFYQYFSSKEDVFWRLAGNLARELHSLIDQLEDPTPDVNGVASLDRWLDELIGLYQSHQSVFVSFREAFRENSPRHPLPRTIAARVRDLLATHAPTDGLDLDTLAEATVATVLRSIHYWLLGVERASRGRFTIGLAATLHRTIFGAIAGVNVAPITAGPPKRSPALPDVDVDDQRPLRPRGRATRQQLLDAAARVLPVRGYHETRVDDIVEEAGFSHGSFYRYFENKDELFSVLAMDAVGHMVQLVEDFPTDHDRDLESWLAKWFESYRSKGGVISAWEEIGFDAPDVVARSADLNAVFVDRLERVVHRRGFGDTSVDALALLAVIEHGPHGSHVLETMDEGDAIDAIGFVIRRGILGTP